MNKNQIMGMVGSFLLAAGVFAPIISLPIIGSLNYFQNGHGDGTVVLVLAVLSLLIVWTGKYRILWVTALVSLAIMAYDFIQLIFRYRDMKANMAEELEGNPFAGLADVAVNSIQIQWGWVVLAAGVICLFIAASSATIGGRHALPDHD